MGDVAKGIKSFKKGMAEERDADRQDDRPMIPAQPMPGERVENQTKVG